MSVQVISAMVATMVARDIATSMTGTAPDVAALESIAREHIKPKSFPTLTSGNDLTMLYGDVYANLAGYGNISLADVEEVITSDVVMMDTYQRVKWDEMKKASALQAELRNMSDTTDAVVSALRPLVSGAHADDSIRVDVIAATEFDDRGALGIINAESANIPEAVLLTKAKNHAHTAKLALSKSTLNPELIATLASVTGVTFDLQQEVSDTVTHHCMINQNALATEYNSIDKTLALLSTYNDAVAWLSVLSDDSFGLSEQLGYDALRTVMTNVSESLRAVLAYRARPILRDIRGERPVMSSIYTKEGQYYAYKITNNAINDDVISNYARVSPVNVRGVSMVTMQMLDSIGQDGQQDKILGDFKTAQKRLAETKIAVERAVYQMGPTYLAAYSRDTLQTIASRINTALESVVNGTIALDTLVTTALASASGLDTYRTITNKVNYAMEQATVGNATMDATTIAEVGKPAMANAVAQVLCANIAPRF